MIHQQKLELKRLVPTILSNHQTLFVVLWIVGFATVFCWQRNIVDGFLYFRRGVPAREFPKLRPVAFNLTDFGGVGGGKTDNTAAFERAVAAVGKFRRRGGEQLNVPAGRWLTAPFNLTSYMTVLG